MQITSKIVHFGQVDVSLILREEEPRGEISEEKPNAPTVAERTSSEILPGTALQVR